MENRIDYILNDALCEKAIENFKAITSVTNWLHLHSQLFNSVSVKPNGLPRITLCHFDGEKFEHIQMFARLYETVNSSYE